MNRDRRPLIERAREYAGQLGPGSEINEETDGPVVRDFRHLLPSLLHERGLYLEGIPGGMRVTDCPPWLVRRLATEPRALPAVWCCRCSRSLFSPDCSHGIRYAIELGEPDWMGAVGGAKHFVVMSPGARA